MDGVPHESSSGHASVGVRARAGAGVVRARGLHPYLFVGAWWAGSRLVVAAVAVLVQFLGWPARHWHPGLVAHPLALLATWDSRWYRIVAERGYFLLPGHESDTAFFPLLPTLLSVLHRTGLPIDVSGIVVSNVCLLVAMVGLYELGLLWVDEETARRAVAYAALFPFGFVFSMLYPEALVLAALVLATLAASRGRWLTAAVFAALAALGRPEGVLVAVPLAALAVRQRHWREGGAARALAAVVAAPAALASFSLYLWQVTGRPLAWREAETAWGRTFGPAGVVHAVSQLATAAWHHDGWLYRDFGFFVFYVVALVLAARAGVPRSWIAAGALIVVLPVLTGSFTSEARFGLLALPVYFGVAAVTDRAGVHRALQVASLLGLVACTATIWVRWP